MQKIINIVKDYLTKETNNALLITGEWGVGKTYFFNNILSKEIEKVSTKENENIKYTPIRISLFGVTSINDIEKRIILEIYPLLKNKGLKIGKGLLNVILSSPIIKELTQQIPENILNLPEDYKSDIINSKTSSLIICFDDLERKSHTFPISGLIGYINNLTENNNLKVMIIGNTNNIEENFVEIKEKLIGREIEYSIKIEEVYNTLKQDFNPPYKTFLEKQKEFICSFFHNYKNIRTLKFILTRYHDIYSQIEKIASSIDYIHSNKDTVLKETLLFTIAISIEYKGGSVTRNNKEEIDNIIRFSRKDIERFLNKETSHDQKNDEEETILKKIKSNYYYQNNVIYYFYEPIFDYIVGLNILDENLLEKDIKKKYKISEDNTIPECYITYNRINSDEVFSMTNASYKQLLTNMLFYVDNGEYRLEHYNRIYNLVLSFNNPLKIKEDKLKNRIIRGIKRNKDKFVYNPELPNKLLYIKGESDVDENEKEIIDLCLKINNEKEEEKHKEESANLIDLLKNDFDHFEHQVESKYNNIPIFKYIKSKEIFNFYNSEIHLRIRLFESFNLRNRSCRKDILLMEKHFYEQLQQSIEKKEKQLKSGPEWALYNSFNELLQSIIKNP
jgi:KAP family P-loop domain protein